MFRFLIFLIFIILIQRLLKTLQEQQKQQQEPTEKEIKNYFQALGLPPIKELPPEPRPEKAKQPPIRIKKPEVKIPELKPVKMKAMHKEMIEETKEELPVFSEDKLEEGIILSAILGPPKAYQIRRSGEIGRHA